MNPPASPPLRVPRRRAWFAPFLAAGVVLATACSSDQGIPIPSSPTLQAAATQVGSAASTVVAAAPPIATNAAEVGGTAIAEVAPAATSVANLGATAVSAAGPAATSAANVAATAAAAASPVATRVATAVSQARATADARTPMNGATGQDEGRTGGPTANGTAVGTPSAVGSAAVTTPSAAGSAADAPRREGGSATGSGGGGVVSSPESSGMPVRIAGVGLVAGHPALTLENTTDAAVDLAGWQLDVDGEALVLPPNTRLAPRGSTTLHLADGGSRGSDVYLGRHSADLVRGLQPGERMTLIDDRGQTIAEATVPAI